MAARQGSLSDWRRFGRGTASVPQVEFGAGSARWNHRDCPPSKTNWSRHGGKGHCRPLQRLVMSARKPVSCPESIVASCEHYHGAGRSFPEWEFFVKKTQALIACFYAVCRLQSGGGNPLTFTEN